MAIIKKFTGTSKQINELFEWSHNQLSIKYFEVIAKDFNSDKFTYEVEIRLSEELIPLVKKARTLTALKKIYILN